MGGSSWSDDLYRDRVESRVNSTGSTFAYNSAVNSGRAARQAHETLEPRGIVVRESRDSDAHPNSVGICVFFDVTGSMGGIPRVLQTKLPTLMNTLLDKGYCEDPQLLMGAVGDAISDDVSMQIGQFESGVEIEENLSNIFLEGGGGGGNHESYQNALYFAARKTSMDCWEKRGKKGFLFLIGDENPYGGSTPSEIETVFGDTIPETVTTRQLVEEAQKTFHVFFIMPGGSYYTNDLHGREALRSVWSSLLGPEYVLYLEDPDLVCETIGATIGMFENALTLDQVTEDLGGTENRDAMQVRSAVDALARSGAASTTASGVPSGSKSKSVRL